MHETHHQDADPGVPAVELPTARPARHGQHRAAGEGVRVQPLQSSLPEESFQTLLVSKLMARLGYDVQPAQEVDYNVAYASVAQGMAPSLPSTGYRCKTTSMSRRG